MAASDWTDISPSKDGSVLMQLLKDGGDAAPPEPEDTVRLLYRIAVPGDAGTDPKIAVDSNGTPAEHTIGDYTLPVGIELALLRMRPKAKALVRIRHARHGYCRGYTKTGAPIPEAFESHLDVELELLGVNGQTSPPDNRTAPALPVLPPPPPPAHVPGSLPLPYGVVDSAEAKETLADAAVPVIDLHPEPADVLALVRAGLAATPKMLPAWLLYDEAGSRLFDAICAQPEYYLTSTEKAILRARAAEMADVLVSSHASSSTSSSTDAAVLVEFGAGSAEKVGPLLRTGKFASYLAVDISASHLAQALQRLQLEIQAVPCLGVCADYSRDFAIPPHPHLLDGDGTRLRRRVGFFPGSSFGNFLPAQGRLFLARLKRILGRGSALLIGVDRPKDAGRLERAYDDTAGVSAAFAKNLIKRLSSDPSLSFSPALDPEAFAYEARWQADESRIEMSLVCTRPIMANVGSPAGTGTGMAGGRDDGDDGAAAHVVAFAKGERLVTEYSYKWAPAAFAALALDAGWRTVQSWSGPVPGEQEDFTIYLLVDAEG